MAQSTEEFLTSLIETRLLSAEEVDAIRSNGRGGGGERSVEQLQQELLERNLLTPYQLDVVRGERDGLLAFGDYEILEEIGRGGMGRVYRGRHRAMNRIVAIKMVDRPASPTERSGQRFLREVKAAARLDHKNIVRAFDARMEGDRLCLVMEYVDGTNLARMVKMIGPLPAPQAVDYVLQAARGLQHAHERGLIHRDVKPSNLLLDGNGVVKLSDFGLVRIDHDDSLTGGTQTELTQTGLVMGTVAYMAPEQAIDTRQADERSDIYSLGCTLYFLLNGKKPYVSDTVTGLMVAHREQPVPALSDPDSFPEKLEDVFRTMVAKDPADRFQTVSELIAELEALRGEFVGREEGMAETIAAGLRRDDTEVLDDSQSAAKPAPVFKPARRFPRWVPLAVAAVVLVAWGTWQFIGGNGSQNGNGGGKSKTNGGSVKTQPNPPPKVVVADAQRKQQDWAKRLGVGVEFANSVGMKFRLIPPGEFSMGTSAAGIDDWKRNTPPGPHVANVDAEGPRHKVRLTRAVYLGTFEVTRRQYAGVTGDKGPGDLEGELPVVSISWFDAVRFCNRLSRREKLKPCYAIAGDVVTRIAGNGYRLPTEAEWEYACRAGTVSAYSFGDTPDDLDGHGWFKENSNTRIQPVGGRAANPFGLYDMHGNVWEWCEDRYASRYPAGELRTDPRGPKNPDPGDRRVVRGGSYAHPAAYCRSASRYRYGATTRGPNGGFRVVREAPAETKHAPRKAP